MNADAAAVQIPARRGGRITGLGKIVSLSKSGDTGEPR